MVCKRVHQRASRGLGGMRSLHCVLASAILASLIGCTSHVTFPWPGVTSGSVRVESLSETPVLLSARFPTAVYADGPVETSFFLSDVPLETILEEPIESGQIVHIELLWKPRAGSTPIENSATNASIRYIIFSEGEVGIYGGAGFARIRGSAGDDTFGLIIRDASIRLIESTEGFNDLLTPGRLTGAINARLDQRSTRKIQHAVSQQVTNALGRSRIVFDERSLQHRSCTAENAESVAIALSLAHRSR